VKPKVVFIGGPDVNARIPLIQRLEDFQTIAVGSMDALKDQFAKEGIEYHSFPLHRGTGIFADILAFLYLTKLLHHMQPDIVHTFDTKPCVWGRLAARMVGIPVIIGTLPGLGSLYAEDNTRMKIIRSVYQPLQRLACHVSDLTIFQNHDDSGQFTKRRIVQENKAIVLLGSGVDTQVYDPHKFSVEKRRQVRAGLGLDDKKLIVIMISRIIRSKGVLEYAQVAKSRCEQGTEVIFFLVGPYDHQSLDMLTQDEQTFISNSVTYLGARDDIPALLAISDIFVLPTYYREGVPRVLLEAASMGLPIVATLVSGCNEVVVHDVNGFLIPVRDAEALEQAIEKLLMDPLLRARFGEASRQRAVNSFDLSIIAKQTAEIYKRLLAEKVHGRKTNS
jgi:glycosyltransferase involved in cell wall biosynthesis